jgi:hypothetical protein
MKLETQWTTFGELPVGKEFWCEGHHCRKKSSRTAWWYLSYGDQEWSYFGLRDSVTADLPART